MVNRKITPLKQPNNWTCYATVAAMLTGKPLEDFFAFVGADGSEYAEDGVLIDGVLRRGFFDAEGVVYLLRHGFQVGCFYPGEGFNPEHMKDWTCILIVHSERFEGAKHIVLWADGVVYDPNPETPTTRAATEYKIAHYAPVLYYPEDNPNRAVFSRVVLAAGD